MIVPMCGFVAVCGESPRLSDFSSLDLKDLQKRGPDSSGALITQNFELRHFRLAITGEGHEQHPLVSRSKRTAILFNGEIYNYRELRKQHGIEVRTGSDTEVILELFERFGVDVIPKFQGMFAIVFLDLISGEFTAVRDRMGVKPLFVAKRKKEWIFSSTVSALLEGGITSEVDDLAIRSIRSLRGYLPGRTFYKEISEVPPGHIFTKSGSAPYWKLEEKFSGPPEPEELMELISKAVNIRTRGCESFATFLSSGVDSAIVAAYGKPKLAVTLGSIDSSESAGALSIAQKLELDLRDLKVNGEDFHDQHFRAVREQQSPVLVPNQILIGVGARYLAEEGVKIVLSGEGADEIFGGYDRVSRSQTGERIDVKKLANDYSYSSTPDLELFDYALQEHLSFDRAELCLTSFFLGFHLRSLLNRLDSATASWGVEARNPFLDSNVVERIWSVPLAWKHSRGVPKHPLRLLAERSVGDLAWTPKIPFQVGRNTANQPLVRYENYENWVNLNLSILGKS